jgi:hypothetical protein
LSAVTVSGVDFRATNHSRSGIGLAYAAFAALGLVWGANFIFVKWAILSITPAQIVLLRVLFGFLPLFAYALATGALNSRDWRASSSLHARNFKIG